MTDRTQFEAMLEALINEDQETAKEIFHNIVVAKSREIYEELLESDFKVEEGENPFADKEEEGEEESEEEGEEEGEEESGDDSEDDVGGDATDDFVSDVDGEEGDEEDHEGGDVEDRVMDLEDALEELKAEFEQLMAGEENEPEHADMGAEPEMGGDMGGMDAMGGEEQPDELAAMMEYVNKVSPPKHGDNGVNTKSIVAGKNDMGGTTANIAKSFSTTSGGTQGGLLKPTTSIQDGGNINKPGANAGKTAFKKKEPGHGAEKKGAPDTAPDKKSLIGSRK
jgi:hypothetical protein